MDKKEKNTYWAGISEFTEMMRELVKRNEKESAKEKAQAIKNIPNWIERGKVLIFPERYKEWEECVRLRTNDLYRGGEIELALQIMEDLENGMSMEEAKEEFKRLTNECNSTGTFDTLIRNVVLCFSKKGPEFWEATCSDFEREVLSEEQKQFLEEKRQENIELSQLYASTKESPKRHR